MISAKPIFLRGGSGSPSSRYLRPSGVTSKTRTSGKRRREVCSFITRDQPFIEEMPDVVGICLLVVAVLRNAEGLAGTGIRVALNRDQNLLAQHRVDSHW